MLVVVCVAAAGLWVHNTSDPSFHAQVAVPVATPGASVTVAATDEACLGPFITWRRRGLLGRWQQTHYQGVRDVVPWYDTGDREHVSDLGCSTGPVELVVPTDIDRGIVAACSIHDHCVKVTVVDP